LSTGSDPNFQREGGACGGCRYREQRACGKFRNGDLRENEMDNSSGWQGSGDRSSGREERRAIQQPGDDSSTIGRVTMNVVYIVRSGKKGTCCPDDRQPGTRTHRVGRWGENLARYETHWHIKNHGREHPGTEVGFVQSRLECFVLQHQARGWCWPGLVGL